MTESLLALARATGTARQFDFYSALQSKSPEFIAGFCIWCEARGAIFAAKLGVAFVIRNRASAGSEFGDGTVLGVVTKPFAFSSLNANDPNHEIACEFLADPQRHDSGNVWPDCYYAAKLALNPIHGLLDPTEGALFYCDCRLKEPPKEWGHVRLSVKLDDLSFYAKV